MAEYTYNKQFTNETSIKIETNDRTLFFKLEQGINEALNQFRNENQITNENENAEMKKNEQRITNSKKHRNEPTIDRKPIKTKFGTARINNKGYYIITSVNEGFNGKLLHRLIYEDYHKCTIIPGHIHHIDKNKINNDISNLMLMSAKEHTKLHKPIIKPKKSKLSYWDLSNKLSNQRNTTGYLHVYKQKNPKLTQGFTYKYTWRENGKLKTLESVNIAELERKVKAKGLHWQKL